MRDRTGVRASRELGAWLAAGASFGLLVAVVKGQDAGFRDALGNLSAPWVVLPFLAGSRQTRLWRAALVGVATTSAAFVAFYLAEAAILDLGPHPWLTDVQLTLGSGHLYEAWGVLSGTLYGALGGAWRARRLSSAPVAVGLAFVCEPLLVWFAAREGMWGGADLLTRPSLWVTEVVIGLAAIALAVAAAPRSRAPERP